MEWSVSELKQVKQSLKYDFASVNVNLLHVDKNTNIVFEWFWDTVGVKRLEIRSVIGWCVGNYWKNTNTSELKSSL